MRKTDAFRRAAALLAALSITVSLAAPAFADTYYIDYGDITITKNEDGSQTIEQGGDKWTDKETREVIEDLKLPEVSGLTLIGGEPMEHPKELKEIVEKIKSEVDKTIWIYSGFTYEKILEDEDKLALLKECDILVDGLFIEKELDLSLRFRGSRNQRVIDIQKSLANGEVTIWDKL